MYRFRGAYLLKTTQWAGAKFDVDSHSRKAKTSQSEHSYSKNVQSSPGERRKLVGGHGGSVVLVAKPQGRCVDEITSEMSTVGHFPGGEKQIGRIEDAPQTQVTSFVMPQEEVSLLSLCGLGSALEEDISTSFART